jgi:hypothetical protein
VRICGCCSKPKGDHEQKGLGNTVVGNTACSDSLRCSLGFLCVYCGRQLQCSRCTVHCTIGVTSVFIVADSCSAVGALCTVHQVNFEVFGIENPKADITRSALTN